MRGILQKGRNPFVGVEGPVDPVSVVRQRRRGSRRLLRLAGEALKGDGAAAVGQSAQLLEQLLLQDVVETHAGESGPTAPFTARCTAPRSRAPTPERAPRPPVGGPVASLEDEVKDLPGQRLRWATHWRLRWEPYPGAVAYELQTLTSEGEVRQPRRTQERTLRYSSLRCRVC
jgi:hypothetical protein